MAGKECRRFFTTLVILAAASGQEDLAASVFRCEPKFEYNMGRYLSFNPPKDNISAPRINMELYDPGHLRLIAGTAIPEHTEYRCKILRFHPVHFWRGIAAQMKFKNDGVEEKVMKVRELDGMITLPDYVFIHNVIVSGGVYAAYKCSESGPSRGSESQPYAFVAATQKASQDDINNALGVMELMGFSLDHKFNCTVDDV